MGAFGAFALGYYVSPPREAKGALPRAPTTRLFCFESLSLRRVPVGPGATPPTAQCDGYSCLSTKTAGFVVLNHTAFFHIALLSSAVHNIPKVVQSAFSVSVANAFSANCDGEGEPSRTRTVLAVSPSQTICAEEVLWTAA